MQKKCVTAKQNILEGHYILNRALILNSDKFKEYDMTYYYLQDKLKIKQSKRNLIIIIAIYF